jgi:hypothetical protein
MEINKNDKGNSVKDRYNNLPANRKIAFREMVITKMGWKRPVFFRKLNVPSSMRKVEAELLNKLFELEEKSLLKKLLKQYPNVLKGDDI